MQKQAAGPESLLPGFSFLSLGPPSPRLGRPRSPSRRLIRSGKDSPLPSRLLPGGGTPLPRNSSRGGPPQPPLAGSTQPKRRRLFQNRQPGRSPLPPGFSFLSLGPPSLHLEWCHSPPRKICTERERQILSHSAFAGKLYSPSPDGKNRVRPQSKRRPLFQGAGETGVPWQFGAGDEFSLPRVYPKGKSGHPPRDG